MNNIEPSTTDPWLIQFIGGENFHWVLVCGLIAMAMILASSVIRGYWAAHKIPAASPMDPDTAALIKAVSAKVRVRIINENEAQRWVDRWNDIYLTYGETKQSALIKLLREINESQP